MSIPRTIAIIQARMGSSRLPCKCMLHLHDRPLIDWVVERTQRATLLDSLVVAVPDTSDNDPLVLHLEKKKVAVFRGPEYDVLERFRAAAEAFEATHVVRVCADNPLIWGNEIDNLIRFYHTNPCDYAYNHIPLDNKYPDGVGAEIVSYQLLADIAAKATRLEHREHCLSYLRANAAKYRIATFDPPDTRLWRPDVRLDIDTAKEYCTIALMPIDATMPPEDIIALFPHDSDIPTQIHPCCPGRR